MFLITNYAPPPSTPREEKKKTLMSITASAAVANVQYKLFPFSPIPKRCWLILHEKEKKKLNEMTQTLSEDTTATKTATTTTTEKKRKVTS